MSTAVGAKPAVRNEPHERCELGDIFAGLGSGAARGTQHQKRPAKYRNAQSPEQTWSGIGRTPKGVEAILSERGIDMAAFKGIPMYQIHT